ncbi:hypothetical protein LZZ85_19170 [Terrimonas sp. NA20]|uniref:Uncharacterized protein n=1 Tax=Terrimonas ginsenosidimutans TaxID=2908004 RepID=A0ABS9KVQ8_9BACT|nr:hypothetical protein [Terrimonas ginsenosidimutans]MCG2616429.1 hypothetical protein [Terrimonas ginsenosidimutans]
MKNLCTLLTCCILLNTAFSQVDDTAKVKLDLLRAPASPAANLLGFATSDIEKPTDISAFMASLQSSSGNNSILPSNYAVDLAPFWLFRAKGLTTDKMDSKKFSDVFRQTFVFSTAVRGADSTSKEYNPANFYNSFGIKFSIKRGAFSRQTTETLDTINLLASQVAADVNATLKSTLDSNAAYQLLAEERRNRIRENGGNMNDPQVLAINKKMAALQEELRNGIVAQKELIHSRLALLKTKAEAFRIERFGFFIDLAGGATLEYVDKIFSQSNVHNAGAWLTFGANYESGWTLLGITRYLFNPKKAFADNAGLLKTGDVSTFDAGARIIYNHPKSKFALSGEGIYRSVLNNDIVDPSWRLVVNAEYDLGNNQRLTFAFGRHFSGMVTRGNVIAALNFLKGFGNRR